MSMNETIDYQKKMSGNVITQDIMLTHNTTQKDNSIKSTCNYSLYIFSTRSKVRNMCWRLVRSKAFEWSLIGLIFFSTVILTWDTYYLNTEDNNEIKILKVIDYFITAGFTLEVVIKAIAYGFLLDSSAYLREMWNVIDLIVLFFSYMDFYNDSTHMKMFRVLRLLRVFRTLRYLSNNNYIKIIFKAIIDSFGAFCNALVFVLIIFLMFAIVGVHFFAGKFQYCSVEKYVNRDPETCIANGGIWQTYNENFDNAINGLIYLFGMTNQEGWVTSIHQALDCTEKGLGPEKDAGWYYGFFYIGFIVIGPMFLMKIFVGILFYNFKRAYKDELASFKGITLTQDRLDWIKIQKLILNTKPDYRLWGIKNKSKWRNNIYYFVTNFYFELFIAIVTILNIIELALNYDDSIENYPVYLLVFSFFFLFVYTGEIMLKLIGLGTYYWCDKWNVLVFINLTFYYSDIIISFIRGSSIYVIRYISIVMRIIMILRITNILRGLRYLRNLQTIVEIVKICFSPVVNVFVFTGFIFFIYAILGCYLFYDTPHGVAINHVYNFQNFGKAMLLIFKLASGEDSNLMMFECARVGSDCVAGVGCGDWYAYIYFMSFRIVINFIMLNLFILVVLHFFDKHFIPESYNINTFKGDYDSFKERWACSNPRYRGNFIHTNKLLSFFKGLPPAFNFESEDPNLLSKQITSLKIMQ